MIPTKHTLRRADQPIQLGPRHGYRIEGDHAFINAELHLPPYATGGDWTLELWATEEPYRDGPLTGTKIAEVALELPTPIGPYVHDVDTRTAAHLPLQGRAHAMVLALVEPAGTDGQPSVHAFANYPALETFVAPHFEGAVGYELRGSEVVLEADGIANPRSGTNLSGTLSVELWAFPVSGPFTEGTRLAAAELAPIAGQSRFSDVERRVAFDEPSVGRHQLALLLCEWTVVDGYVARDRRDFAGIYERSAPESAGSSPIVVTAPVPPAAPARPADRLRLVPTPEPKAAEKAPEAKAAEKAVEKVVEAKAVEKAVEAKAVGKAAEVKVAEKAVEAKVVEKPVETKAEKAVEAKAVEKPVEQRLVSIQTATVEELAGVQGLNLKLAKEIIKARPFTSLADLVRVRGIGAKTIDRLKRLLTV